jgi:hypothetical protein
MLVVLAEGEMRWGSTGVYVEGLDGGTSPCCTLHVYDEMDFQRMSLSTDCGTFSLLVDDH